MDTNATTADTKPKLSPPNNQLAHEPKVCTTCTFRRYCATHEHTCHTIRPLRKAKNNHDAIP